MEAQNAGCGRSAESGVQIDARQVPTPSSPGNAGTMDGVQPDGDVLSSRGHGDFECDRCTGGTVGRRLDLPPRRRTCLT